MDNKLLEYHMQKGWVVFLFVFYITIIFIGISFLYYIIISKMNGVLEQETIKTYTFFVSVLSSAMMTGIRYTQKLYKACIDGRVLFDSNNKAVEVGNVAYFFLRPIYSIGFSVIFVVCLLGGIKFLNGGMDCVINERTVYLSAIVSAVIGYSIGKVLDMFELVSKDYINKII